MNSDSDDSSTDNEATSRLQEALETGFVNANLYSQLDKQLDVTKKQKITKVEPTQPKSIRNSYLQNDEFDNLGVTPEFQKFVAKKLAVILDNQIEEIEREKKKKRKDENIGGIKLLKNSQILLNDETVIEDVKIKMKKINKQSDKITEDDLKTVAVSPEDILSQHDVKFWSKRTKRKPFEYKQQSDGRLLLIEPKFI